MSIGGGSLGEERGHLLGETWACAWDNWDVLGMVQLLLVEVEMEQGEPWGGRDWRCAELSGFWQ